MVKGNSTAAKVAWGGRDVIVVSIALLCIFILSVIAFSALTNNERMASLGSVFITYVVTLVLPVLWIRKRYGIGKERLGLRKGKWPLKISILIGLISGFLYMLLEQYIEQRIFGGKGASLNGPGGIRLLGDIASSFSLVGALFHLLVSVAEESFFRGFLYGYARSVIGVTWALICQATLFGILHWGYLGPTVFLKVSYVCVGLLLGILYERSDSVIPGVACHWVMGITAVAFGGIPLP